MMHLVFPPTIADTPPQSVVAPSVYLAWIPDSDEEMGKLNTPVRIVLIFFLSWCSHIRIGVIHNPEKFFEYLAAYFCGTVNGSSLKSPRTMYEGRLWRDVSR